MPFNFGSFAGGLAEGMQRGAQLQQAREEAKLKQKMLDAQAKHQEFQNQQLMNQIQQAQQAQQLRQSAADALQASYTGGQQAQPGYEDQAAQMSRAEVPAQTGPNAMTPEQTYMVGAARQGHFFPPHQVGPTHIPENALVPKPGGGWERAVAPTPKEVTSAERARLDLTQRGQDITQANTEALRQQQQQFHRENLGQGQQRIDIEKERLKTSPRNVPKTINFKDAKTQLEAMAGKYKSKDIAKIKTEMEAQANQLGYTIQGVRPGMFGWNIDIAPVAPSKRGGILSIEERLDNMLGK